MAPCQSARQHQIMTQDSLRSLQGSFTLQQGKGSRGGVCSLSLAMGVLLKMWLVGSRSISRHWYGVWSLWECLSIECEKVLCFQGEQKQLLAPTPPLIISRELGKRSTAQLGTPDQGASAGSWDRDGRGAVCGLHCHGQGMAPGTPADKETLWAAAPPPAIVGLSSVNQSILKGFSVFFHPGG